MFERELNFFIAHQDELVAAHRDKFLVIRGESVVDTFQSALEAYVSAQKTYPAGTFMIQHCRPGTSAYTVTLNASEPPPSEA